VKDGQEIALNKTLSVCLWPIGFLAVFQTYLIDHELERSRYREDGETKTWTYTGFFSSSVAIPIRVVQLTHSPPLK
jgi:hypothetical protein